jgi:hypothetical protein
MLEIKKNTAFDIADEYITHEDGRVVVEYILTTFPEVINREDKEAVIDSITYKHDDNDKTTERAVSGLISILADKLITLSDEDFKAFAINNYDSNFTYED